MDWCGNKFSDFRENQLSKFRQVYTVRPKGNIAPQKHKNTLSSRKHLFYSQIASAIDYSLSQSNRLSYEHDRSDIPA